jgi:DNA-binding MarR family transcriptional regulator
MSLDGKPMDCEALAQFITDSSSAIQKALHRQLNASFDAGGLTLPQRLAMQVLVRDGAMSIKDLAAKLDLSHSTVSGLLQRLEKRGVITREPDPEDARISRVRPSRFVEEFMRTEAPARLMAPLAAQLSMLSEADRRKMKDGLQVLRRLLNIQQDIGA